MGKYFLIGIPNCGKSTLGQLAADMMKLPFFDTDTMTCDKLELENPVDIFRSIFNQGFMNAQRAVINELAKLDGSAIIATGAEISLMPECARIMRTVGTIIHIKRSPEIILENLRNREHKLIFLKKTNGTEIDMQEAAVKSYMQEYSQYEAIADISFDNNGNEEEGVQKLVTLINMRHSKNI